MQKKKTEEVTAMTQPLAGRKNRRVDRKVCIFPSEISAYLAEFPALGAQVDLLTRLWGAPSRLRFRATRTALDAKRQAKTLSRTIDGPHRLRSRRALKTNSAIIMCAKLPKRPAALLLRHRKQPSGRPCCKVFLLALWRNPRIVKGRALPWPSGFLTPATGLAPWSAESPSHEVVSRRTSSNAGGIITASGHKCGCRCGPGHRSLQG